MWALRTAGAEKSLPSLMILLRSLFVPALLFLPGVVSALDITAWKGETVNAFLPDGENVAEARDGFVVKVGALKGVNYNQAPVIWRKVMSNALDRVTWGDPAATSRVVQVRVPRDAKPGVHAFGDLRVKVLDRTITPVQERSYYLDLWQHPWAVARVNKAKPFSKEHYDAMRPLWTELASLGQKVITTTIVRFPWSRQCCDGYETMVRHVKAADGSWLFDYSIFDEYVTFAKECGLGPEIACYSICPWDEGRIWWDEPGKRDCTARAKPGTKEYEDYWGPFLVDFAKHLKEKGWFANTAVALDERSPEDSRAAAELVRRMAPGLRISLAGNKPASAFEGIDIDIYSQSMEHIKKDLASELASRRAKGFKTTYYVCNSPLSPNTFVFSSPDEGYFLGLYPVVAGFDGFLRWAYNSWPPKPMERADYAGLFAGDTFLVYPDGSPSIRLLMLQNGLEAAEKYCQLMAAGEREDELDELAAKFDAKESLWKKAPYFSAIREAADKVLNAEPCEAKNPETPTMGWSSWNAYRVNISDKLIMKQAYLLVELGLDKCGYKYVNIDDGYFGGRDENGKLKTHPERFPNGLKDVVDHVHGLGLKAGIYSDAGADTCGCFWDKDVLGEGVGLYRHERQDAEYFFDELGFDFIKIDFCGGDRWQNKGKLSLDEREQYTKIRKAIDSVKPGVRINVCRWNYPGTWVREIGSSWRISADINPTWGRVKAIIKESLYLSAYAAPGAYNDMDMLEVGRGFSDEEDQTHFAVWCMMSSPLLIGCDLEKLKSKPKTLALLKNKDLIALDQDTAAPQAYVVHRVDDAYVLVRDIEKPFGKKRAAAFVNLGDKETNVVAAVDGDLDLAMPVRIRDLIAGETLDAEKLVTMTQCGGREFIMVVSVPAHGTRIYEFEAAGRRERDRYEAETAYLSTYQELHDAKKAKTGYYEKNDKASGGMVAANVGGRRGNYLAWNNVWSERGGEYRMFVKTLGEGGEVKVKVNGVACGGTASGDGSGMVEFHISLKPGVNSVRLFNNEAALPLIDCMWINKIAK